MDKQIASKLTNLIGNISVGYKGSSPDYTPSSAKADLRKFLESLDIPVTSSETDTTSVNEQEINRLIDQNLKIQEDRFRKFVSDTLSEFEAKLVKENDKRLSEFGAEYIDKLDVDKLDEFKSEIRVEVYRGTEYDKLGNLIKTYSRAKIPEFKHPGDSGADAYVCFDDSVDPEYFIVVSPGQVATVPLGINCCIPQGYEIQIRPRSGKSSEGIIAVLGTIDWTYRGIIKANVVNLSPEPFIIKEGDRLCQLVVSPILQNVIFASVEGNIDTNTVRGINGFGSTGTN